MTKHNYPNSPDQRAQNADWHTGRVQTEETKHKISEKNKAAWAKRKGADRKHSAETIEKMRAIRLAHWQNQKETNGTGNTETS